MATAKLVWQNYDLYLDFPELQSFLELWRKSLEGVLHAVTVARSYLIEPVEIKTVDGVFRLHRSATSFDQRPLSLSTELDRIRLLGFFDAPIERKLRSDAFVIWREVCFRFAEIQQYPLH